MSYPPESIIAVAIVLPLLALVAVLLRLLVRLKIQPTYVGIDDWFAILSVLLALGFGAIMVAGAVDGTQGRVFMGDIPHDRYVTQAKLDFATVIIEKPLYGGMKLCALFFFRRIFLVQKRFRRFSNIMIVLVSAWTVAFIMPFVFACGTRFDIWFTPGAPRTPPLCVDVNLLNLIYAITDAIGDTLVVLMPFPCIHALHMARREKYGLAAVFLLGSLSTVASFIRLGFVAQGYANSFGKGGNNHGSGIAPAFWSLVEAALGVLAVCLPPLSPLIGKGYFSGRLTASLNKSLGRGLRREGRSTAGDTVVRTEQPSGKERTQMNVMSERRWPSASMSNPVQSVDSLV